MRSTARNATPRVGRIGWCDACGATGVIGREIAHRIVLDGDRFVPALRCRDKLACVARRVSSEELTG